MGLEPMILNSKWIQKQCFSIDLSAMVNDEALDDLLPESEDETFLQVFKQAMRELFELDRKDVHSNQHEPPRTHPGQTLSQGCQNVFSRIANEKLLMQANKKPLKGCQNPQVLG